jgi:prepilin-type N-terminal cleavage/methylation domain-containing protein
MSSRHSGFTLVELAIVLMIIGLLIGGILKGQELINNARVTTTLRHIKSFDAATITFQDSYGALPGDIVNPATRLPNCAAANCNLSGNGNSIIGNPTALSSDENAVFWLHLSAANLVSGIDMNSNWTGTNFYTASYPAAPAGGFFGIIHYDVAPDSTFVNGVYGVHWTISKIGTPNSIDPAIPINFMARIDQKIDDGKPWSGDFIANAYCGGLLNAGDLIYPTGSELCSAAMRTGF